MTHVVTGATGLLGANLVRALLEAGHQVRAVAIEESGHPALDGLDVPYVRADVRDPAQIRKALDGAEVVHHLAAKISILSWDAEEVRAINVGGVSTVVEACLATGVRRLVHVSSIHALSPHPHRRAVDEGRELAIDRRLPAYRRSKANGEQVVRAGVARGLDAVILNPTGMLGPHDHGPSEAGRYLRDVWHGRANGLLSGGFNWVDARDVADAAVAAATSGRTGERYILAGGWVSVEEFVALAAQVAGVTPPRIVAPQLAAHGAARMAAAWSRLLRRPVRLTPDALRTLHEYRLILTDKAHDELGFRARPFEQTLRDAYHWYRTSTHDPALMDAAARMAALAAAHHGSPG